MVENDSTYQRKYYHMRNMSLVSVDNKCDLITTFSDLMTTNSDLITNISDLMTTNSDLMTNQPRQV